MIKSAISCLVVAAIYTSAAAQPQLRHSQSVFLEFANAPAFGQPLVDVLRLGIGVGEMLQPTVVDTGSTGVVLSARKIPGVDRLPMLGRGTITYSSSGRIMIGRWVATSLTIAGRVGRVTRAPLPMLAVDEIQRTPSTRHCTAMTHPTAVSMLGIGFGREHDKQADGTPDRHPQPPKPSGKASLVGLRCSKTDMHRVVTSST